MTESLPGPGDDHLDRLLYELRQGSDDISPLERRLVETLDRLWLLLQTARRDITLLQEEQRGWSRREMSIDRLDPSAGGEDPSRQWGAERMEIDKPD